MDIDLIIRGLCVLRPGIAGVSDRIRVRSIVGRFLEHSRSTSSKTADNPELYLGSADLMERNLDRRVETLCRVSDEEAARHLRDVVIDAYLRDNDSAYILVDDRYRRLTSGAAETAFAAQQRLLGWYSSRPHASGLREDAPWG